MQGSLVKSFIWFLISTQINLFVGCYSVIKSPRQTDQSPQTELEQQQQQEQMSENPQEKQRPSTPTILPPKSPTNQATVRLTGSAEPGVLIEVSGAAELARTIADQEGRFSVEVTLLPNQVNQLSVTAYDREKRASASAQMVVRQVQATSSAKPVKLTRVQKKMRLAVAEFQIDLNRKSVTLNPGVRGQRTINPESVRTFDKLNQSTVAELIRIDASNFEFDLQNKIFSFDMTLTNKSQLFIFTPIRTVIQNLQPGPPNVKILNADGGGDGNGAFWDYTTFVGLDKLLVPAESSTARNWQFFMQEIGLFSFTLRVEGELERTTEPPAPIITQAMSPTNQPSVLVLGTADPNVPIEITGGVAPTSTTADNQGAFSAIVALLPNKINRLFATATNEFGPSAPAPFEVIHDTQPPSLFIDVPADSAELTNEEITVVGRVGDMLTGFMGLTVTVNGLPANVVVGVGTNGTFERRGVPLALGLNTITVTASDELGNSDTSQVTVTRIDVTDQPQMVVVSGNNQKAQVNQILSEPIMIQMTKPDGSPFLNKIVTFKVVRSNGLLTLDGIGEGTMMLQVRTDGEGLARAFWQLGSDAGCGNNRVSVTSTSIAGTILFCATATPNPAVQINIGSGNNQRAETGGPAQEPLRVWVNDGVNGLENIPVTFTVKQGGGKVNGADEVTINTGITGHAQVDFNLGPNPGNNTVEATFPDNTGQNATFVIFGTKRTPEIETSFTGLVLDNANQPIEGATCILRVGETTLPSTTSDAEGRFTFTNIPTGPAHLLVDGLTATAVNGQPVPQGSFPSLSYDLVIVPNIENRLSTPVLLPPLNPNNVRVYDGTEDVELTVEGIEGLKMIVKAGSMTLPDGSKPSPQNPVNIALNQVHFDNIPMPMPDGTAPFYAGTLQPIGATFNPPVKVIIPNMEGLPPGTVSNFLSFNHSTNRFEIVATGEVTADGSAFVTDPGSGIHLAGWHGRAPPPPPSGDVGNGDGNGPEPAPKSNPPGGPQTPGVPPLPGTSPPASCEPDRGNGGGEGDSGDGDPVYLFAGEYYYSTVDLRIRGRVLDFIWARKYRSKIGPNTVIGNGWDFSYNIYIERDGENIRLHDGNTRSDFYLPDGTGRWVRGEFFRELVENDDGTFSLIFADKGEWLFHPFDGSPQQGKITASIDRNGNTLTFEYDATGRLVKITDTLDRDIIIGYNADGFIETVTDFAGRVVRYEYYDGIEPVGSFGDLKSVTSPTVSNTPNGNDFPNGKTISYTYSTGFADERLNHNLLTITDGRRNDPTDPTFGEGPYLVNVYSSTQDPDDINFDRVVGQIWGGDIIDFSYVQLTPTDSTDAVIKTIVNDRVGNVREYSYDVRNRLVRARYFTGRADPTKLTTETVNRPTGKLRPGDPEFFETRYEWNFDALGTRVVYPNGNITEYVFEFNQNPDAKPRTRGNLRVLRRLPGTHTPAGDQVVIEQFFEYDTDFGSCCGFNFVTRHIDGRGNETIHEYDDKGNRIFTRHRIFSIIEEFEYNVFGQMTVHVWPDNGSNHRRLDEFTYYETGPQRGYLKAEIIDAPNFALTTTYEYDVVGNVIRVTDPRGHDTQHIVNELDQVVREISREVKDGSGIRYERDYFYDANNNLTRIDIQNIDDQGVVQSNTHFTSTYEYEILNYRINMAEEVDSLHTIITEYEYDGNRNLTLTRYGEATNGNQPTNIVRQLYDERDLLFKEIRAESDPDQSTIQYDYDNNRNLITRLEGLEETPHIYNFVYDGYNRLVSSIDPMGNLMTYNYDENHNRVGELTEGELVDALGSNGNVRLSEMVYVYDAMDRLIQEEASFFDTDTQAPIDDGASTTQTFYSDNSQVIKVIDDRQQQTLSSYDTANRLLTVTDHKQNSITYAYDANNNVIATIELEKSDLGNPDETFVTTFEYDNLDRLIQTIDNIGNINEYAYDSRNNRTLHNDALRVAPDSSGNIVTYEYDGINRLIKTTRVLTGDGTGSGTPIDSIITTQNWDDTHRLIAQTDDNGNTTTYAYDALNRKTTTLYADGTVYSMIYDVHDNAITMTDANGSVATCTYDLLDRLVNKTIARGANIQGTTFEIFQYDGLSRLVLAQDDDSEVTRSYNSLSYVTRETLNGQITTSLYDGVGNKISCTYPGGRIITVVYDSLNRKETISDQNGFIASYKYIGPARVERRDYGNNTRSVYEYDPVKRITRTAHIFDPESAATIFDDRTYTWDQMYNKTSRSDVLPNGLTHEYQYDSIYRLIRSNKEQSGQADVTIDYKLDGVGNRNSVTGGPNPGSYFMDATLPEPADFQMNQYTTTSFDARLNDLNGNLIRIDNGLPSQRNLIYDYRNQMVQYVDIATGTKASYKYDALGRRIEKLVDDGTNSETIQYFYKNWQVCEEQDESSVTRATYVYGLYIDEVLNMRRGGNDFFYHTEELYNVMKVTDVIGGIAERYDYGDYGQPVIFDASGNIIANSTIGNPYFFTGRRYDSESGFYYYRTRYLYSQSGRFNSRDSIGIWGDESNMGNGYTYVATNPFTYSDSFGFGKSCQEKCREQFNSDLAKCFAIPKRWPLKPSPGCVAKAYIKLIKCLFNCAFKPTPKPRPTPIPGPRPIPCEPPCYCGV